MSHNNFNRQNSRNNNRGDNRNDTRKKSDVRWFNAHTEGCGYINGLRFVSPKQGQTFEPFWASTFCMLEGDPANPTQRYISVTISSQHVIDILLEFEQEIASGQVTVFAGVKLSNLEAAPFVFDEKSRTPGELGINWSARVINLFYLKVGDEVITVKSEPTTDMGVADDQSRGQQHQRRPQGNQQYHQGSQQGNQGRNAGNQNYGANRQDSQGRGHSHDSGPYSGNQQTSRQAGKSQRQYQQGAQR